jgi:uncharacterized protein (TIGR03085 family)
MTASSRPFAERERADLADLLDQLGPDAPTCCGDWTTADLAAHLAVRDRRPDALLGFGLEEVAGNGPLPAWAHRLERRLRDSTPYADVVAQVRSGPPVWSVLAWPGGRSFNVPEFAIHHEDVRRAQPEWAPRTLSRADQDALWTATAVFGRRVRGGVVLRRTDVDGVERRIGDGGRTVAGEPMELLLWTSGRRDVARITVS